MKQANTETCSRATVFFAVLTMCIICTSFYTYSMHSKVGDIFMELVESKENPTKEIKQQRQAKLVLNQTKQELENEKIPQQSKGKDIKQVGQATLALNQAKQVLENEKSQDKGDTQLPEGNQTPSVIHPMAKPAPSGLSPQELSIWKATEPWTNVSTIGFGGKNFYSGYRNQMQAFNAFMMKVKQEGRHDQILMTTLNHKDVYGTNKNNNFAFMFDVAHWNSFYPRLPRIVRCDPDIFTDFDCEKKGIVTGNWKVPQVNATKPYAFSVKQHNLMGMYNRYAFGKGGLIQGKQGVVRTDPVDLLIIRGALRPHPDLVDLVDGLLKNGSASNTPFMTLHARVEPDMQKHPVCRDKKVVNLTQIFESVEKEFPDPPATRVFMPINRQKMEEEGVPNLKNPDATNWIAVENLAALNHATKEGLWGGRAQLFECGSNALQGTKFEKKAWSIAGAMLNYLVAQRGDVFIGTEVSSYSMDLVRTRFYNGNTKNYKYLPDGLHRWTTDESGHPPAFRC